MNYHYHDLKRHQQPRDPKSESWGRVGEARAVCGGVWPPLAVTSNADHPQTIWSAKQYVALFWTTTDGERGGGARAGWSCLWGSSWCCPASWPAWQACRSDRRLGKWDKRDKQAQETDKTDKTGEIDDKRQTDWPISCFWTCQTQHTKVRTCPMLGHAVSSPVSKYYATSIAFMSVMLLEHWSWLLRAIGRMCWVLNKLHDSTPWLCCSVCR